MVTPQEKLFATIYPEKARRGWDKEKWDEYQAEKEKKQIKYNQDQAN